MPRRKIAAPDAVAGRTSLNFIGLLIHAWTMTDYEDEVAAVAVTTATPAA